MKTLNCAYQIINTTFPIWDLVCSPPDDSSPWFAFADGSTVRVFCLPSLRESQSLVGYCSAPRSLAVSSRGAVALGGADGSVNVWVNCEQVVSAQKVHKRGVGGITFSPDGEWMATAGISGELGLWRFPFNEKRMVECGGNGWALGVAFSPDGYLVVTGSLPSLTIYCPNTWEVIRVVELGEACYSPVFLAGGKLLFVAVAMEEKVLGIETTDWKAVSSVPMPSPMARGLAASSDTDILGVVSTQGVGLWEVADNELSPIPVNIESVTAASYWSPLGFSPASVAFAPGFSAQGGTLILGGIKGGVAICRLTPAM